MRKLASVILTTAIVASLSVPAMAGDTYVRRVPSQGEAVAAGVLGRIVGGLLAGAVIASSQPRYYVVQPAPRYYHQPRVLVNPYTYNYGRAHIAPRGGCRPDEHMGFLYDPDTRETVYTCE